MVTHRKIEQRLRSVVVDSWQECDRCHKRIEDREKGWLVWSFSLHAAETQNCPDGVSTSKKVDDLCQDCAGWLFDFLEMNGVTVRKILE